MSRAGSMAGMAKAVENADRAVPPFAEFLPVTLVLDNLRSAFNVGNIFRLAEATRVEQIVTCGYTATPPHPKLRKTARDCDTRVRCRHAEDIGAALDALQAENYVICGIETVANAETVWNARFRFPTAFVLGNEALGLSPPALARCREFVRLPCLGTKNSINVANCAAVVLYRALEQWLTST